ncbi:MAG: AAA family ATPase [Victivallales bacterium]|nr:AAA family ATPase [Victivallales bacterium]
MIIKRVKISNYKTYLSLDLDLSVAEDRPIILIGGANGGGKTTLFEGIYGALYGLKIKDKAHFDELLNNGALGKVKAAIELEVTFSGQVLTREQKYILRRTYTLNPEGKPLENIYLSMDGNAFAYGTSTPAAQRIKSEQQVNKIIKANLPQELSKYFLFDAMQSSDLLKDGVFAQIIRENFENVMGFNKYVLLRKAAEKLQQEKASERLAAEQEKAEYDRLCKAKDEIDEKLKENAAQQDGISKFLQSVKDDYDNAKAGARNLAATRQKVADLEARIADVIKSAADYSDDLKAMVESLEANIFLPRLASEIAPEVEGILREREKNHQNGVETYSEEKVREIAKKIFAYLKDMAVLTSDIDEESVVSYIMLTQERNGESSKYDFLDEADVNALAALVNIGGSNNFARLNETRQACEAKMAGFSDLQLQKQTFERQLIGGNDELITQYESKEKELQKLQDEESVLLDKRKALEKKIHQFDIAIQQEPDVKFDTLVKLKPFFEEVADALLKRKRELIETEMCEQLNKLLVSYKGVISKVCLSDSLENFTIKMYHQAGNEISLNQLNAASKQIFIQVLLKVLRNLGDYNPPVMIDTVMGVLDNESRDALMEEYFPQLAEQTILLCTTSEIRKDSDYIKLEPFISRTYTLKRDVANQRTDVVDGYFGIQLNND